MDCPTLISVSLTPGPYFFSASAGWATRTNAAPTSAETRMDICLLPSLFVLSGASVIERYRLGNDRPPVLGAGRAEHQSPTRVTLKTASRNVSTSTPGKEAIVCF